MRGDIYMQYLKTYLDRITDRGNIKLAESISKTSEEVGNRYIKNFSFSTHEIGLLFGNVQSGKTGQMFGIMCKAADLGFPVFVLLTTDNIVLQQQTLSRVKSDLEGFCICGETDAGLFAENSLIQPAIIVLKKNVRVLKLWANIFNSTGFMKGNPLFIIDDEADAASLNTLVNKDRQSSINKYLDAIKKASSSSLYLQVTGTPQAVFLQTVVSGWHPYFTYYFQPGDAYLGGDFFFPIEGKPSCVSYVDTLSRPTREVVIRHIVVSSQILLSNGKVSNCLFHPSVRVFVHEKVAYEIKKEINWCIENINGDFKAGIARLYDAITPSKSEKVEFSVLFDKAKELLLSGSIKILIMNGKNHIENSEYESGCNFVIGGNTLGRGVTFPSLQTIYYTRTSKKPQADTMWQHSRMFGYDRDPGMMMVYIEENLYKLFADINSTNNSIIAQVEHGIDAVKIYYPNGLNPTRKNILDNDHVEILSGGTNYYPFYPDNDSIEDINKILEPFADTEPYYQVSLRLLKDILSHIIPSPDFKLDAFLSVIDTILAEQPTGQGILLVRRNRNIAQGTGALLSPNDWHLGGSFTDKVVLTMYQVTGTKGWDEKQLWIPNIKLPNDTMYYDVIEGND
ncbi:Z1 domain-containing protein [Bifidobacterium crudilactis]|uniref:Z1 domain-containing protein n=2 Tax=Bifidobacterium crudilactis TaxID=327277 RepID=UPI00264A3DF3|nr:Z1 domain-containing protein [Bifidobacterium crudilactis]MDN5973026.1 Z1 domain-containing protein [Bifidobacterium crudilactis]MDN6000982.1 Z1 domain-containing protein [Bifidobacterium crudilactis]MDN6209192.1 Z1 domain-containing protein [Bifidobacterium crudilactis]MDN6467684.1 Z1 domain-containing protein [Bifidobacterium crudilactis]MDN6805242.1 Z1 domain-containing protein [Bifidobacterium crudilactis]